MDTAVDMDRNKDIGIARKFTVADVCASQYRNYKLSHDYAS
jgi:hypothetical protein